MEVNWAVRYEALRAHALGQAPVAFIPLGLGVLCSRGVAAWMRCETVSSSNGWPVSQEKDPPWKSGTNLSGLQAELAQLLAGAALLTVRPVSE
jgi:hypothetical protein